MLVGRFGSLLASGPHALLTRAESHVMERDRRATDGIERIEERHELMPGMTSRAVKTEGRDGGT